MFSFFSKVLFVSLVPLEGDVSTIAVLRPPLVLPKDQQVVTPEGHVHVRYPARPWEMLR